MAIQATYAVYGLDLDKTYEKLRASKDCGEIYIDRDKNTMSFWVEVDNEKVNVQISAKGAVNLWHRDENCIGKVVEKLKALTVNSEGEECREWQLRRMQKIGAKELATEFDPLLKPRVKEVLEELNHDYRFFRWPTVEEVAVKIGEPPETVRPILYKLALGWREQTKEEAKKEAEESINLAGWMKWLEGGDEHGEYSSTQIEELNTKAEQEKQQARREVIERARMILENYPKLVPEARPRSSSVPAGLDPWSEETKRVWRHVFQQEAPKSGRDVIQKPILRQAHMLLHYKEEAPKNQEEMSTQNHPKS